MITAIHGFCMWPECKEAATQIAADTGGDGAVVGVYCDKHSEKVIAHTWSPTVVADCPNCQCTFGVWP